MFFEYIQNNSGGSFIANGDVDVYVIVEAMDAEQANFRALGIGIYFNGCDSGFDCPCCGDRWTEAWEDEGTETPTLYGKSVLDSPRSYGDVIIHYLDGRVIRVK